MPIDKTPFAFLITIRTYNTWVHGDARESVDRIHNIYGTQKIPVISALANRMRQDASETPFVFNSVHQYTMLHSIIDTFNYNNWYLFAAHVRTNHVHIITRADQFAEKMMGKIKCYGTKALKNNHAELKIRKNFWSRHGSTVNIWSPEKLFPSLYYVIKKQGDPTALYYDKKHYDLNDEATYEAYFL